MSSRRSEAKRQQDRAHLAEAYLRGEALHRIAAELGISVASATQDLREIRKAWLKSALIDFNQARSQEIAKIDAVEREFWRTWSRDVTEDKNAYRHLQGILQCVRQRCDLLGLTASTKISYTTPDGQTQANITIFLPDNGRDKEPEL
jgi:hypothetical protein